MILANRKKALKKLTKKNQVVANQCTCSNCNCRSHFNNNLGNLTAIYRKKLA